MALLLAKKPRGFTRAKLLLTDKTKRWTRPRGAIASVILMLWEAGWEALAADRWTDQDGTVWQMSPGVADPTDVLVAYAAAIRDKLWDQASHFHNGAGIVGTPDTTVLRQKLRSWKARGDFTKSGACEAAVTAATWTRARKHQVEPSIDPICPACGGAAETDAHRIWGCRAHKQDTVYAATDHLRARALADCTSNPALWLRGIVPADLVEIEPPLDNPDSFTFGADALDRYTVGDRLDAPMAEPGPRKADVYTDIYGDGSGGPFSADPRLRRCGWGWCIIEATTNSSWAPVSARFGALPGQRQTVNRSELYALLDAVLATRGALRYTTDSMYVMNSWRSERYAMHTGSNHDLWQQLGKAMTDTGRAPEDIVLNWVPSHTDANEAIVNGTTEKDWIGNHVADTFADKGAAEAQVDESTAALVQWLDEIAGQVITRITRATIDACERDPTSVRTRKQHKDDCNFAGLRAAFESTAHRVPLRDRHFFRQSRYVCGRCRASCAAKPRGVLKTWLKSSCSAPAPTSACFLRATGAAPLHVGNRVVHSSHKVFWCSALTAWVCGACGARGGGGTVGRGYLQGLVKECPKRPTRMGAQNLRALQHQQG